jgi:cytochrome c oxidase subunit 1
MLFTMHGTIMVFFVLSTAPVSGFGNMLIPLQVGARDMAFPFLNGLSFWTFLPGCVVIVASFFVGAGAAAGGWTSYPPLSALRGAIPGSEMGQTLWIIAMVLFIASFTMGGLNFMTTILNCRTKGMSMMRLPLTCWAFLVASILGVLAFPPLTAAAIMLLLDRHAGTSFFMPGGLVFGNQVLPHDGGTPLLFQHLFWFLGHPEVYVLVLPPVCMMFDVMAPFTRRPVFGYRANVVALLIISVLSMIVWAHHMFTTGMNPWTAKYFSVATVIISAPFSILGINLLASLWRARMRLRVPFLFVLGLISTVGFGGLGGLFLGTQSSDVYLHDTYFVVGHFHLMIGTVTMLGIFGAVYFWFPKWFGRTLHEGMGKVHFWLTFAPMVAIFLLMHYQGFGGMPRRYFDQTAYDFNKPHNLGLMPVISILAFVVFAGQLLFLANVGKTLLSKAKAADNPWEAAGLEWSTPTPPPHGNFGPELPVVHRGPYEYTAGGSGGADFHPQAGPETA